MRGATSNQCPECGYVVVRREALQHDANIKRAIDEHEEAVAWGRRGMILSAVGLGVAVFGLGLGVGPLKFLARLISLLVGVVAFFLGIYVFRTATMPDSIRGNVGGDRSHGASVMAALLGVACLLIAVFGPW